MISHANVEVKLAAKIKDLLRQAIAGLAHADVWYSEDPGALKADGPFFDQIIRRMNESKAVVAIQSPISRARPWPLWECGYAFGRQKGPYIFTFAANESIRGHLGSPLDVQQQYDGTNVDSVNAALQEIAGKLKDHLVLTHYNLAAKFVEETADLVLAATDAESVFDRRLIIVATKQQFDVIVQEGIIPPGVKVLGNAHTFNAFNYSITGDLPQVEWGKFAEHLREQDSPWPDSSVRWANALAQVLQKAKDNRLIQDAEALPLYYSLTLGKSLRPALTKRANRGSQIEFEVTFVDLPPEIVGRAGGDLGILFHYLDLGRMLRWGVLESGRVLDLRTKTTISSEELQRTIKAILSRIFNIRTDFFNRGLEKNSLMQAVSQEDSDTVFELMKEYNVLMDKLDPLDGVIGKALPDRAELLSYLGELLRINKRFMEIVSTNIREKVKLLPIRYAGDGGLPFTSQSN